MLEILMSILLVSLAISSISMTITKSNIMHRFRDLISKLGKYSEELIHCPYCLSHWLAALMFPIWCFYYTLFDAILMVFGVVTLSSFASLGIVQFFLSLDDLEQLEENNDEI